MKKSDLYIKTSSVDSSVIAGVFAFLGIWIIFALALTVFLIICNWTIYKKAGEKGCPSGGLIIFQGMVK